jgi:hypothetical protein
MPGVIYRMALITKMLDVAVADCDAGRITPTQLISILQEAIDNGDILEEQNEFCVVSRILPGIDRGILSSSEHVVAFESRMAAKVTAAARQLRGQATRPWWKFWR